MSSFMSLSFLNSRHHNRVTQNNFHVLDTNRIHPALIVSKKLDVHDEFPCCVLFVLRQLECIENMHDRRHICDDVFFGRRLHFCTQRGGVFLSTGLPKMGAPSRVGVVLVAGLSSGNRGGVDLRNGQGSL